MILMENVIDAPYMDACSRGGKLKKENVAVLRMKGFAFILARFHLDSQQFYLAELSS